MAVRHQDKRQTFWQRVGHRIQQGAEVVGTLKGAYDTGRTIYSGMQAAAPYVLPIVRGMI